MKKITATFLVLFLLITGIFVLTSCSPYKNENGKIKIVTTVFPEYDWTMNILGDKQSDAEITLLLDSGADLHSFQPTVSDIAKIADCDLFIYIGGESDNWVQEALKNTISSKTTVINLMETLGERAKEEEIIEGMQSEEDGDEGETEYDEHVWLSLKNAQIFVDEILKALCKIDGENSKIYENNAAAYKEELSALDKEYEETVQKSTNKTLLFGDRFPFRYLTDDYGLSYYAAFVGCSAETEASFETIAFLARKVDELGLNSIIKIESSDGKIAETIKANSTKKNQQILTMDSLQSATKKEYAQGRTYLNVMSSNLSVLSLALK